MAALTTTALSTTGVLATGGLASPASATSTSAPLTAASWLSSIPDNAAYRRLIAVNDLRKLWTSAGLSFPPTSAELTTQSGTSVARQIAGGSPLGSVLAESPYGSNALGYNAMAIGSEVAAGLGADQLSMVQGPIVASRLGAALRRRKLLSGTVSSGAVVRYSLTAARSGLAPLQGTGTVAVLGRGGRAVAAGSKVPTRDVVDLLQGHHAAASLAADPDVRRFLKLMGGADVMLFGTGLIVDWGTVPGAFSSRAAFLRAYPGLDRMQAGPTFAGYGYLPGHPDHATALAVAIYPSHNDAAVGAQVWGRVMRSGRSYSYLGPSKPFSQLFAVDKVTVDGAAVVVRLTELHSGTMDTLLNTQDIPLFWSPN